MEHRGRNDDRLLRIGELDRVDDETVFIIKSIQRGAVRAKGIVFRSPFKLSPETCVAMQDSTIHLFQDVNPPPAIILFLWVTL
jgi:hypothetical protein